MEVECATSLCWNGRLRGVQNIHGILMMDLDPSPLWFWLSMETMSRKAILQHRTMPKLWRLLHSWLCMMDTTFQPLPPPQFLSMSRLFPLPVWPGHHSLPHSGQTFLLCLDNLGVESDLENEGVLKEQSPLAEEHGQIKDSEDNLEHRYSVPQFIGVYVRIKTT
jgi:hypothetical protein